ncbi:pr125 [rat cytomegalovirus strain Maastricht]|uniref:Pr125 n=1 Tax=Rat cytomegalovirus (strain Maastricht) TaxID=79700 RepID=Q9DW66_RCMVM|nr:pr125 [rat cytomegalovirus strain Maastricht]AAF99224.1 pr125 [rat cytomegalovirus strain Maastricht]
MKFLSGRDPPYEVRAESASCVRVRIRADPARQRFPEHMSHVWVIKLWPVPIVAHQLTSESAHPASVIQTRSTQLIVTLALNHPHVSGRGPGLTPLVSGFQNTCPMCG